jgi:hypothetical protein
MPIKEHPMQENPMPEKRMADICRSLIDHPSAWTSKALGGRHAVTRRLGAEELAAFDDLIDRTRELSPQMISRRDVDYPALAGLLKDLHREIMQGRGLVVVSGLDPSRYSAQDLERIFWGIGTHLGDAAIQSRDGDRLGRVERDDQDPVARGYRSAGELVMHTDSYEVVGLLCVRKAAQGGESAFVSSLAIHNVILQERPDLLPALYEGFHLAIPEARLGSKPVTDEKIPVFCLVDGRVSCMVAIGFMREAARQLGVPLPGMLSQALDFFAEVAQREDLALRFMLEPGEMALWHNFTNLHSRTRFEDDPQHKRLLLRLWLTIPDGRPIAPSFHARGQAYDRVYDELRQARQAATPSLHKGVH